MADGRIVIRPFNVTSENATLMSLTEQCSPAMNQTRNQTIGGRGVPDLLCTLSSRRRRRCSSINRANALLPLISPCREVSIRGSPAKRLSNDTDSPPMSRTKLCVIAAETLSMRFLLGRPEVIKGFPHRASNGGHAAPPSVGMVP